MTDERKQELLPFFALTYSRQINPERYGSVESLDEFQRILEGNPEDMEKIAEAASKLSDEQWSSIENEYNSEQERGQMQAMKKGAKLNTLKTLRSYKKGSKMIKKCECGCNMAVKKEKGGKLTLKCSCGCKNK